MTPITPDCKDCKVLDMANLYREMWRRVALEATRSIDEVRFVDLDIEAP